LYSFAVPMNSDEEQNKKQILMHKIKIIKQLIKNYCYKYLIF